MHKCTSLQVKQSKTVRKHHYGLWTSILASSGDGLKLKRLNVAIFFLQTQSWSLHKMLTDGLESCGLLEDYCDVFISCLNSHSNSTHSLQRVH